MISPELVNAQLLRVLDAPGFQNSATLTRFLKFIVTETLAGHETELKEYIIALNVLSKRTDFDPHIDPIVRIHAGRLRRTLNEYYSEAGRNDGVIISIPKGAYVPVFSLKSITLQHINGTVQQDFQPGFRIWFSPCILLR